MRTLTSIATLVVTIVAAAAIGFGVPLAWLWIGSQLQGDSGATSLHFSVAMAILFGIILSYVALLYLAGVVMARLADYTTQRGTARSPWMRGMTDTRHRDHRAPAGGIERIFVITTMIVTAAFWIWFAFESGSPLPNQ